MNKPLIKSSQKKSERTQMNIIRNKKEATNDAKKPQRNKRKYYK